jgi:hypothetical protein
MVRLWKRKGRYTIDSIEIEYTLQNIENANSTRIVVMKLDVKKPTRALKNCYEFSFITDKNGMHTQDITKPDTFFAKKRHLLTCGANGLKK